jgi:hypothetical protein
MSLSEVRVKLVVAAGVVGASLLAATFVGCQSNPTSQAQNGQYGQYNGGQYAANQPGGNQPGANQYSANPYSANPYGGGFNGQQAPSYGSSTQMASAGGAANGFPPQSQQAFLNETQRLGTQQNLSAQDVVAMARSGVPDQQIALAVQQRGAALRTTPGVSQYLAQNGVNPAVLGTGQPGGSYPGAYTAQTAMSDRPTAFGPTASGANPPFNNAPASAVTSATYPTGGYPTAQADSGQVQSAGYESSMATPALDTSASTANGAMTGQSWRAIPR